MFKVRVIQWGHSDLYKVQVKGSWWRGWEDLMTFIQSGSHFDYSAKLMNVNKAERTAEFIQSYKHFKEMNEEEYFKHVSYKKEYLKNVGKPYRVKYIKG